MASRVWKGETEKILKNKILKEKYYFSLEKRYLRLSLILISIFIFSAAYLVAGCTKQEQSSSESISKPVSQKSAIKNQTLILATTTSTKDTGLLDVLLPVFEDRYGITVKPIAVGTGEALKMGERGDADVLLVHSKQAEDEFMKNGFGKVRKDVMHNDFVLIGPVNDPANAKKSKSAIEAFKKIARSKSMFISRGDDSGTNKKELDLWNKAGVKNQLKQEDWYISSGQGMAATIRIANEKQAYTLSDRATYLVQRKNLALSIIYEKDKDLFNYYGVIAVNPDLHSKINFDGAMCFVDFITSKEGQKIISEFGKDKFGQSLFVPDAK